MTGREITALEAYVAGRFDRDAEREQDERDRAELTRDREAGKTPSERADRDSKSNDKTTPETEHMAALFDGAKTPEERLAKIDARKQELMQEIQTQKERREMQR